MIRGSNRGDNVKTTVYMGLKSTNETNQHGAHVPFHRGTPWPEPGQWDQGLNMANKVMKKLYYIFFTSQVPLIRFSIRSVPTDV